jgi:hypothetical protein
MREVTLARTSTTASIAAPAVPSFLRRRKVAMSTACSPVTYAVPQTRSRSEVRLKARPGLLIRRCSNASSFGVSSSCLPSISARCRSGSRWSAP